MITFRQKPFVLPALAVEGLIMGGTTAAGLVGGGIQQKQATKDQERLQNEQLAAQKKLQLQQQEHDREMLQQSKRIAEEQKRAEIKAAKAANGGGLGLFSQKEFVAPSVLTKVGNTIFDIGKTAKQHHIGKTVAHGLAMGGTMAGIGYVTDKVIQRDAKKSGIPIDNTTEPEKKKNTGKKLLKGAALLGTTAATVYGAKTGKLGANMKNVADKYISKSAIQSGGATRKAAGNFGKQLGTGFKEQFVKNGKFNLGGTALTVGIGAAIPTIGYVSQKQAIKEQERSYSIMAGVSSLGKTIAKNAGKFKTVARTQGMGTAIGKSANKVATSTLSGISSFMGGGGKKGVEQFGKDLATNASKDSYAGNIANFMSKHKKTALAGSVAVGSAVVFKPWEVGEKAVKKGASVVDKNAFAYEKSQNQQIQ